MTTPVLSDPAPHALDDAPPDAAALAALRVQAHAEGVPRASLASLGAACILLVLLRPALPWPGAFAWLALLIVPITWRLVLRARWRRGGVAAAQAAARLRPFRLSLLAHGLVWGLAAWLPPSIGDGQVQPMLAVLLVGLTVGSMIVTLYDLPGALLFGGGALLPLALRLLLSDAPLQPASILVCLFGLGLMVLVGRVARQADAERRSLVAARRAERASARGAHAAQDLLREVLDHAGLGISVFDADQRLMAWSSQMAALTGIDPALLRVGLPMEAVVRDMLQRRQILPGPDPDAGEAFEAEVARRLQQVRLPHGGTSQVTRPDGRLIEIRRNPLPRGGFVMFHTDITQREASRRAAEEQQRMLALVLERTEQGFWYIDNALRTTDANRAMCRMLGLTREQLLGRNIYEFVDADNRAIFQDHVGRRARGQASSYEITLTAADGRQVHCLNNATPVFDDRGHKTGALGLFSDISAQKAAAEQVRLAGEALTQKSNVLAWTLDSLDQGVLNVDPQGRCTAWNSRFLQLLQLPAELLDRRPMLGELLDWQLANGDFGSQLELLDTAGRENIQRAQAGVPQPQGHFYRRRRRDGTVLDIASHFAADGSLVRTFTDVTARLQAEAALIAARDEAERARVEAERAREEAEAANRAKSEFLSRMSHELRTPLNAILGFAQLLQAQADEVPGSPGADQRRQWLDAQMRGGRHLLALINDVLDVARIDGGRLQLALAPVDLPQVVHEALALVQPMAQQRGVVLLPPVLPGPGDWRVQADATRLRQVLLNLLSNAVKFNRDAGEVRLQVAAAGGGMLRLEVADQGAGMTPQQLPRLFQAFERLDMDGAVEGTGIGLALSRSLMTLMHGTIGVHSTPGQGSVFWLELPRATGAPAEVPVLPPPPPARLGTRRHDVLYIEDNEVNQLLMQGMLAHRPSIDLRLADLPETGLAMARAQPPDLVLLDIQLPGMDGFEVLRRLRQHPMLAHTPVIAVSANAMPADLAQAREAGFDSYLTKPLDMHSLLKAVDAALDARLPMAPRPAPAGACPTPTVAAMSSDA